MSGNQTTDYMLWMPEAMQYTVDEANGRNLDAADVRANEILELAVTEQDLLSKFKVKSVGEETAQESRIAGNFTEQVIITDEDVSSEDQERLVALAEEVGGAENLVELLRVSHLIVKTNHGGVVEEDSVSEHSYSGTIGVRAAIDEKLENREAEIGQIQAEAQESVAEIHEEIDGLLQIKRTRGNRDTADIDTQIEDLESRISSVKKQAKKDIKQIRKANNRSVKALEKAVDRVEESERRILDTAHDRIAARIRKANHIPTDGSVLDMDSYDDFWQQPTAYSEDVPTAGGDEEKAPVKDKIFEVNPESGERIPVGELEPIVDISDEKSVDEETSTELSEQFDQDFFDNDWTQGEVPESDCTFSPESSNLMTELNESEELQVLRTNFAKLIAGRKNVSLFSRKFSQKKLFEAEYDYREERNAIISRFINDNMQLNSQEDIDAVVSSVYQIEAANLICEQLEYSYRQPEDARLRSFFQKWSDSNLSIAKKALYMMGPATVAGSAVGFSAGALTGRLVNGVVGGVSGAISGAGTYVGVAARSGDESLRGINDSDVSIDYNDGDIAMTRNQQAANEAELRISQMLVDTEEGDSEMLDNQIMIYALEKLRKPGVNRTRKALVGTIAVAAVGLAGAFTSGNGINEGRLSSNDTTTETSTTMANQETTTTAAEVNEKSDSNSDEDLTDEQKELFENMTPEEEQNFIKFIAWAEQYEEDNPVLFTSEGLALQVGTPGYYEEMLRLWNAYFGVAEEATA